MKISRELKTAFIILGGIALFVLGFNFLKSSALFDNSKTFYAVYEDVSGLTPGTSVDINGLSVGTVKDIRFVDGRGNLVVTFTVSKDFEFSKNSEVEVYDTGIIGGKNLRIIPVFDGSEAAASGDTLVSTMKPGITELVTQRLTPLQEKLESLLNSADTVLVGMDDVMDEASKENLRKGISHFDDVMANLNSVTRNLDRFLTRNEQSLNRSLAEVEKITQNLSGVSAELANADVGQTVKSLQSTIANLNGMITKMQTGDGSMANLINDKELYTNLSAASDQLNLLLEDMRLNPKRYVHFSVFGKKNKEYEGPAEKY
ncbi:MCE family protein [Robertkochia marina]|uniref:MCE family protein n=1 Tax=Robertkochia marina TaxID=1227945 RepID=A0A4S3LZL7_9FLAO|nr:MlaD family protein [Robertkochia marina]THD66755.1 MCE family protein [Robertkochia marina]TRZ42355.1 MCE family protein [Robertkochia marina]